MTDALEGKVIYLEGDGQQEEIGPCYFTNLICYEKPNQKNTYYFSSIEIISISTNINNGFGSVSFRTRTKIKKIKGTENINFLISKEEEAHSINRLISRDEIWELELENVVFCFGRYSPTDQGNDYTNTLQIIKKKAENQRIYLSQKLTEKIFDQKFLRYFEDLSDKILVFYKAQENEGTKRIN